MLHRPKWLFIWILVLGGMLAACTQPPPPTPLPVSAHVQCFSEGHMVFDQTFDRAELVPTGHIKVWLGEESVELEGECRLAP